MKKLGVNVDHVATLRNARGGIHPDPFSAAIEATRFGADSITIHLREDRRHIKDSDVKKICKNNKIIVNLEMAANLQMLKIALKNKPNYVCIVPEKRKEVTTEGGLNISKNKLKLKKILKRLNKANIRTSLFVNPTIRDIKLSKEINSECIEIHTGKISDLIKAKLNYKREFNKILKCAKYADKIGLEVHAGHGMDYKTTKILNSIKEIKEFNIGHFIIGETFFYGIKNVIRKFKVILRKSL